MHDSPAPPPAVRASAAGLTLLVHGLFTLLLVLEERTPDRPLPPSRRLNALWIHLPQPGSPSLPTEELPRPSVQVESPEMDDRGFSDERRASQPPTAITLPSSAVLPGPGVPQSPTVDWQRESSSRALRTAEALEGGDATFSPPAQAMREPCKSRKSSFAWKDKPPKEEPLTNPLLPPTDSVKMGGARVGVVGFSISFGPKPEPNKHLFDDMKAGRTPYSSVPDPNYCD